MNILYSPTYTRGRPARFEQPQSLCMFFTIIPPLCKSGLSCCLHYMCAVVLYCIPAKTNKLWSVVILVKGNLNIHYIHSFI